MTNAAAQTLRNAVLHGDCLNILPKLAANSVDFILTDLPYITRYQPRDRRKVPNDDNATWLSGLIQPFTSAFGRAGPHKR